MINGSFIPGEEVRFLIDGFKKIDDGFVIYKDGKKMFVSYKDIVEDYLERKKDSQKVNKQIELDKVFDRELVNIKEEAYKFTKSFHYELLHKIYMTLRLESKYNSSKYGFEPEEEVKFTPDEVIDIIKDIILEIE